MATCCSFELLLEPNLYSVVAKKLGCRLKIKLRQLKEGLKYRCALLIYHRPNIQPVITAFSGGEFRQQPALSDNTAFM